MCTRSADPPRRTHMSATLDLDPNLGLAARNDLLYIADHWADLRARLRPGGGNALTGMPSGTSEGHCPIDVHVSDLLREIEDEARMLGHVLMDEATMEVPAVVLDAEGGPVLDDDGAPKMTTRPVPWQPRTSRMPALLVDVAQRYGHWTAGEDRTARDFCDWAHEYAGKVRHTLERPAPPTYVGPCQGKGEDGAGCGGELYLRDDRDGGTCRECGAEFTYAGQRDYVAREMQVRLMTLAEIVTALAYMDRRRSIRTLQEWVQDEKLKAAVAVEGEAALYRFRDALELAEMKRGRPRVTA